MQQAYKARGDVALALDGGFAGAERFVAVFTQPDWGVYQREDVLAGLCFTHRLQDTLHHQDVLGAVLGLGLSRAVLGDIFIEPGRATAVCLADVADFIVQELGRIGQVGVRSEKITLAELPALDRPLREKQLTVASLRLDAMVAAAYNWSRAKAAEAILAGKVQLAHRECLNTSKAVEAGQIISVRGQGRAKLLAVLQQTRKGKTRITLGYY